MYIICEMHTTQGTDQMENKIIPSFIFVVERSKKKGCAKFSRTCTAKFNWSCSWKRPSLNNKMHVTGALCIHVRSRQCKTIKSYLTSAVPRCNLKKKTSSGQQPRGLSVKSCLPYNASRQDDRH